MAHQIDTAVDRVIEENVVAEIGVRAGDGGGRRLQQQVTAVCREGATRDRKDGADGANSRRERADGMAYEIDAPVQ